MAGKQALSSFFLRSHAASHKCCLFHVGSGLFLLRVASEGPGESLHGHSWGRPPHLLGLPPGLCGQVDLCSSVRGSASSCQRAGGLGPGPVLTLRSLSSSLTDHVVGARGDQQRSWTWHTLGLFTVPQAPAL